MKLTFKCFCLLLFYVLLSFTTSAQNKITGTVTDNVGNPLTGVSVKINNSSSGTFSDAMGSFTFSNAQPFPWSISISYTSYIQKEFTITKAGYYNFSLMQIASLGNVTVVGTRGQPRSDVNRPVPVDIISAKELQSTGQTELGQQLQFSSPSYNSAKYAINGSLVYANYATLRGLGPDQLLVLINGKRRHQFSIPHIGFSISRGAVVTDMNAIPYLAVDHTEILRDGGAAQYGSDAIAGIVNVRLRSAVNQGIFKTQFGINKAGDGATYLAALNYGFGLGKENSFLNLTFQYQKMNETDRSDPYSGTIYNANRQKDDSTRAARGVYPATGAFKVGGAFGSSEISSPQFFLNAAYPLNTQWSIYSFGGYSYKKALGYGFFRNAISTNANANPAIYPNGYTPQFPAEDKDYSGVIGLSRSVLNGWNLDFSTGIGKNAVDRYATHTTNASMGSNSPTDFYAGYSSFTQSTTEANISKSFDKLWNMQSLNLAFGSQFRVDHYQQKRGDENAYAIGPLAASQNKTPGVQGIAGTSPADEANETRTNIGIYADVEADITKRFLVALAMRYENYSDFGDNFSGRFAARYNLRNNIAVRTSVNRGFRAPSLQQIFNSASSTTVQAGTFNYTRQFRSDDAFLASIGITKPKAEISWDYNVGLTLKAGAKFLFTVDAYQIDITHRIVVSEALSVNNIAALKSMLQGTGIQQISFFTNAINTKTQGIDFVSTYKTRMGKAGRVSANLGMTFNKTKVDNFMPAPSQLQKGTARSIALIDTINIALIETAQPRQKIILSLNYVIGKFEVVVRASHFGKVVAWEKPANLPHIRQEFGGKTLFDASVNYTIFKKLLLTVGGNNITDVYPDRVLKTLSAYTGGQAPFNRNVNQFGFNGAYYYTSLTLNF